MINDLTASRPRGRPRAFDRDQALGEAGLTFWRLGYEGASIVDLTAAMGITPQSLYAAFGSKAALYTEALSLYQAQAGRFTAQALAEEPTVVAAFTRILLESATQFTRADQPNGCMISTASLACAEAHRPIVDTVASLRAATLSAFEARIRHGVSQGDVDADTDPVALARFVGAIIQGLSVQARDGASEAELLGVARLAIAEVARHGSV